MNKIFEFYMIGPNDRCIYYKNYLDENQDTYYYK